MPRKVMTYGDLPEHIRRLNPQADPPAALAATAMRAGLANRAAGCRRPEPEPGQQRALVRSAPAPALVDCLPRPCVVRITRVGTRRYDDDNRGWAIRAFSGLHVLRRRGAAVASHCKPRRPRQMRGSGRAQRVRRSLVLSPQHDDVTSRRRQNTHGSWGTGAEWNPTSHGWGSPWADGRNCAMQSLPRLASRAMRKKTASDSSTARRPAHNQP